MLKEESIISPYHYDSILDRYSRMYEHGFYRSISYFDKPGVLMEWCGNHLDKVGQFIEIGAGPGNLLRACQVSHPKAEFLAVDIVRHPSLPESIEFLKGDITVASFGKHINPFLIPRVKKLYVLSYLLDRVQSQVKAIENTLLNMNDGDLLLITLCLPTTWPADVKEVGLNWITSGKSINSDRECLIRYLSRDTKILNESIFSRQVFSSEDGIEKLPEFALLVTVNRPSAH